MIGVLHMKALVDEMGRSLGLHSVKLLPGGEGGVPSFNSFFNSWVNTYKSCAADLNSARAWSWNPFSRNATPLLLWVMPESITLSDWANIFRLRSEICRWVWFYVAAGLVAFGSGFEKPAKHRGHLDICWQRGTVLKTASSLTVVIKIPMG